MTSRARARSGCARRCGSSARRRRPRKSTSSSVRHGGSREAAARPHKEGGFIGIGGKQVSPEEQAALDEIQAGPRRIAALPNSAKQLIRSGALGHFATIGGRGAPQVTLVWVAVDGDDLLTAHLNPHQRKLDNVRRDPRVTISFEGTDIRPPGLLEYLVVHGTATIEEGGAPSSSKSSRTCTSVPRCAFPRWTIRPRACGCGSPSSGWAA